MMLRWPFLLRMFGRRMGGRRVPLWRGVLPRSPFRRTLHRFMPARVSVLLGSTFRGAFRGPVRVGRLLRACFARIHPLVVGSLGVRRWRGM